MPGDRTPGIDKEIERIASLAKEWKYEVVLQGHLEETRVLSQ